MPTQQQSFGACLSALRKEKRLSQKELAARLNIARGSLSRYETGLRFPDFFMIGKLAEALDVSEHLLIDRLFASGYVVYPSPQVLVVEDEPAQLKGVVSMLKHTFSEGTDPSSPVSSGADTPQPEVFGFYNAQDALSHAKEHAVHIAFLDVRLGGGVNGAELAKQILQLHPAANIIFLTGYEDYMSDALQMHASGYILKPLTAGKLRRELRHLRHPVRGV